MVMTSSVQPFLSDAHGSQVGVEWAKWKRNFRYFVEANEIEDPVRKMRLLLLFAGEQVQEIYDSLDGNDIGGGPLADEFVDQFERTVRTLDEYFASKTNITYERHLFRQLKQEAGEKMVKFAMRLRIHAKRCGFGDQANDNIRDQMIEKCLSSELRREILKKPNPSMDDILQHAAAFEAVEQQEKVFKEPNGGIVSVNKIIEVTGCTRCGSKRHQTNDKNCPAIGKKCFRCNGLNHFQSKCRSKANASDSKGNQRSQPYHRQNRWSKRDNRGSQPSGEPQKSENINSIEDAEQVTVAVDSPEKPKYVFYLDGTNRITCLIGSVSVSMVIDSGSRYNIVDKDTWESLKAKNIEVEDMIRTTEKSFKAYGGASLTVIGTFKSWLEIAGKRHMTLFYVVDQQGLPLLGLESATKFGVLKIELPNIDVNNIGENLKPLSTVKDIVVQLPIDTSIAPVSQPYRRVPVPVENAVDQKIDELLEQDIIEPVNGYSEWISPVVVVRKDQGSEVRICVDMRRANLAIKRENHPLPVIDDFLPHINGAKFFSKLDVKQAFHQIELAPESRPITTFITRKGLFRYKRLMFGISCAPEIFQKIMEKLLAKCEGCLNYVDDIIIYGDTEENHNIRLKAVLDTLRDNNVALNVGKCVLGVKQIKFLGHVLSESGISPSIDKIKDIQNFRSPKTAEEVRSFLGLVNYVGKFIPDLATLTYELRILMKKETEFRWSDKQQAAFEILKKALTSDAVLGYFDKNDRTRIFVDASPVAVGGVLMQQNSRGWRVIAYASKSLSDVEKRYSQTEKEALALVWGPERFHFYVFGKFFELITDHKALEVLFAPMSKPCARIERWVLRLQSYQFKVIYRSGKLNIADSLSRLCQIEKSQSFDDHSENFVNFIAQAAVPRKMQMIEIVEASKLDPEIAAVRKGLETANWTQLIQLDASNNVYKLSATEFCFAGEILLRGTRIVMPKSLRQRTLELAHEGHPGMTVMKQRIRSKVWWPKIDDSVEKFVKQCRACILVSVPDAPEPLRRMPLPAEAMQHVAVDFLGPLPNGMSVLVAIDYYSRYQMAKLMRRTDAKETVFQLKEMFDVLGYPQAITCDNGPQFISEEFKKFCDEFDIKIVATIPYWPQQNGEVERQNRSLLKILRISHNTGGCLDKDLTDYLKMYRATRHPTTGKTPNELCIGRNVRDKLPTMDLPVEIDEDVADRDKEKKEKGKVEKLE